MNIVKAGFVLSGFLFYFFAGAQQKDYPKGYFRNPLNIPMQLVSNFGELRSNHWHMGLDIRTQQKQNLPVYAAAEGYIARIKIEPGGFGRAIYINHPNGLTTLYAHLNNFTPALEQWVKSEQYRLQSWEVELNLPAYLFPVQKGSFFAWSGNTGGSQGPHVHFEIRDTETEKCLNPLLFGFPIADAVPPSLQRLALYDRNRSVHAQARQLLVLKKTGSYYSLARSGTLKVGTDRISFALGAVDRFSGTANSNGIYSARILVDGMLQSEFILDSISYDETRYMNAHIDYRYKTNGGAYLQHLSKMPGDSTKIYTATASNGVIYLAGDQLYAVRIEVRDAAQNLSVLQFNVQYDPNLPQPQANNEAQRWTPEYVNVFETDQFEAFSTEYTVYDTVIVNYSLLDVASSTSIGAAHIFMNAALPAHDAFCVRIKATRSLSEEDKQRTIILNTSGKRKTVQKAGWKDDWAWAKFRQFGTYQAFVDSEPPTINEVPADLSRAPALVFRPKDNFNEIKSFRAEVDGQWLRFTNDKGRSWIYRFDEKFPRGEHTLKVTVEDEAGNVTTRVWNVRR